MTALGSEGVLNSSGMEADRGTPARYRRSQRPKVGATVKLGSLVLFAISVACAAELSEPPVPAGLAAMDREIQEHYQELRVALDEAGAGSPAEKAEAWGALGGWHLLYQHYDHAVTYYARAEALAPSTVRWAYLSAHADRLRGHSKAAQAKLLRSLELDSDNVPARVWLAELLLADQQSDRAKQLFEQALARDSRCAMALVGLGKIARQQGDSRAAADFFERALDLQGQAVQALYPLARLYGEAGESERAANLLARVPEDNRQQQSIVLDDPLLSSLEKERRGVLAHVTAGRRARAAGRPREAIEHLKRAIAADDENLDARLQLALVLIDMGRRDAARRELEAALQVFPGHPRLLYRLASVTAASGELQGAREHLEAALVEDPGYAEARQLLGEIELVEGRSELSP